MRRKPIKTLLKARKVSELTPVEVQVVPPEDRSNWSRKVALGEFVTSVEVLPPKGCDAAKTLEAIRLLKDAGVDAVNIPDGPRAQTRMSAQATAIFVEQKLGIEAVLHYCCRDRNLARNDVRSARRGGFGFAQSFDNHGRSAENGTLS